MQHAIPAIAGIPVDFLLFAAVLVGVAVLHHHTLRVALVGVVAITVYKLLFSPFQGIAGLPGLAALYAHEWVLIANLFLLLIGFAILSRHFEQSEVPLILPRYLPDDWKGGFAMLALVFVLSSFLDNIAAAMIGGSMAMVLYRGKVHIGFLAAIVAASNAGGSGSVVGDTTTTMMWIAGVRPGQVFEAYLAAVPALIFFGYFAARQQHALQPILRDAPRGIRVDWGRLAIVFVILAAAVGSNVYANLRHPEWLERLPIIGIAVWLAILGTAPLARPDWAVLPAAARGSIFLLALVLSASMMPVEALPAASWQVAFGLGFVSAVFDNIPLTALALRQGGYDWGFLAYAVGFGGSMIWFGSSAGVALSTMYPQAKSVGSWISAGWHVAVGYVLGFMVLLGVLGWHAEAPVSGKAGPPAAAARP
jgi:Na+/H+ antiporter NhaD/arsenite permease-like protein